MDGWITIGTELDTSKFNRQVADLENKIKEEEKKQEINIDARTNLEQEEQKIAREAQEIAKQYEEASNEAERLRNIVNTTKAGSFENFSAKQNYEAQVEKVDEINAKLEETNAKHSKIEEKIAKSNLQYQTSIDKVTSLKARIGEISFKEAEQTAKSIEKSSKAIEKTAKAQQIQFAKAEKGIENIQKGITGAIGKLGKMALAVLSIRSAYMLVRNAASTLSKYNEQFATNLDYIRFVIAQGLAPILEKVVGLIQTIMAYANYLLQRLLGVNLFAKGSADAFKKANDNMSGMAKSSKEIKNNLASFDEINVLDSSANEGATGGGLAPSVDIGGLEDVEIPEWLKKIGDFLEPIGNAFKGFREDLENVSKGFESIKQKVKEIATEFEKGFKQGEGILPTEELKKDAESIGNTLKKIFTDPEVTKASKTYSEKVALNLGRIAGSAKRIGVNTATLLVGSAEGYLTENEERIENHLVEMFDIGGRASDIAGNFSVALADVSDVFSSQEAQDIGANIIATFVNPLMSVQEFIAKFGTDIFDLITAPFIDNKEKIANTIQNTFEPIKEVTTTLNNAFTWLGDKINEVYDNHIHPFFESLKQGTSDTFGKALDVYNEHVKPVLDEMAKNFTNLWEKHLKPMFEKIAEFIGKTIDLLTTLYEKSLKPIQDWIIQNIIPVIMPILRTIGNAVGTLFGVISDVIGNIFTALGGLIDFIKGVFTGDWETAWNGIKTFFVGLWDGIIGIVKGAINIVIDVINGMIGAIESALNWIADKINSLEIRNPFNEEVIWSPNIPKFTFGRIPHLAKGGIINTPTRAIIGEAGREAVLPLENNTEWMDALAERLNGRSGDITIRFTGTASQLVRMLKPELDKEDKRAGRKLIIGGAY